MAGRRGWAVSLSALLLLAAIASYVGYRYVLHRGLVAAVERARVAGCPVTLDELDAWYATPPPGKNAADLYLAAFLAMVPTLTDTASIPIEGSATLPKRTEPLSKDMMRACVRHLELNAQALDLLHQARALTQCRYPIDPVYGMDWKFQHEDHVREAMRLLMLAAVVGAEQGRSEEAASFVLDALAAARSLEEEPAFHVQLVRFGCCAIMREHLGRVLSRTPFSTEQLSELDRAWADFEVSAGIVRGVVGVVCRSFYWLDDLSAFYTSRHASSWLQATQGWFWSQWMTGTGRADSERAVLLDLMPAMIAAHACPFPERVERYKAAEARLDVLSGPIRELVDYLLLVRSSLGETEAAHMAVVRTVRAGLALERYRMDNGRYPGQLAALTPQYSPEPLLDPFDGAPLRYHVIPGGFVVYSIGRDRNDDGGDEGVGDQQAKDVTFTVERAVTEGGVKSP